jgi:hypothetical protein
MTILISWIDYDILCLNITMTDITLMTVVNRTEYLLGNFLRVIFIEVFSLADFIEEFTTVAEFRNNIEVARISVHIYKTDNARVVEPFENVPLVFCHRDNFFFSLITCVSAAFRHFNLFYSSYYLSNFMFSFKDFTIGSFTDLI